MEIYSPYSDVERFIQNADEEAMNRIIKTLDLLEEYGNKVGPPQSKMLERNLFELRIEGLHSIRITYMFYKGRAALLSIFIKKSQKIPKKELSLARMRKKLVERE